jgi:hypothetical protein
MRIPTGVKLCYNDESRFRGRNNHKPKEKGGKSAPLADAIGV